MRRGRGRRHRRPLNSFDPPLPHERTSLAWERTGLATVIAGALLARTASEHAHYLFGVFGALWVAIGGVVIFWAEFRYDSLHGPLRAGENPVHPTMVRFVGVATVSFIGFALMLIVYLISTDAPTLGS